MTETEPGGVTVTDTYDNLGELTGQSGDRRRRGHRDPDLRLRRGRELTSASTSNTAVQRVERDQRVVHLRRPRPGADRLGLGRVHDLRLQRRRPGHLGRGRGRDHRLHLRRRRPAGDAGRPGQRHDRDLLLQPDSQVSQISYGTGSDTQSFGYDGLHRLTSDTLKTASGHHRRVDRLRVRRRRRDHLPDHHRPGRAVVEHLHLRRGGPADLVEQRHHHHGLRLRQQREPDPGRGQDLHLRRPRRADQRRDRQLHLHRPGYPVVGVGPVGQRSR